MKTCFSQLAAGRAGTTLSSLAICLGLWLRPVCGEAQGISCGQTITNSISSPGQTVTYAFNASAGEVLDMLVLGQTFNAAAEIYGPAENQLGSCTNNFSGPVVLTTTGPHTIRVHADNLVSTGTYGISLSFLTGHCGQPLSWGLPVTNALSRLAEADLYTLSGNAGETAVFNTAGSNVAVAAFVADPTGAILVNWINGAASLNLTNTGTYTVGLYSFYLGATGSYSVILTLTKLVPASFRLAIGTTNGAAALTIWGQVGRATTLHYRPSLPTNGWLTLTSFNLPWSPYRFLDWASTNSTQRVYRTVQ